MELSKSELRDRLLIKRLQLSGSDRKTRSLAIQDRLNSVIDWTTVNNVHCFEPIENLGEVEITAPKNLDHFSTRRINESWKVVSVDQNIAVPAIFDVIIVPMLGFNNRLHRIGFGGGYYDQFLAGQPDAIKIGVCFELGYLNELPAEEHDISMDIIVTEDKVRR